MQCPNKFNNFQCKWTNKHRKEWCKYWDKDTIISWKTPKDAVEICDATFSGLEGVKCTLEVGHTRYHNYQSGDVTIEWNNK